MGSNIDKMEFNYDKNYYFLNGDEYLVFPKDSITSKIDYAKKNYYQLTNNLLNKSLFEKNLTYKKYNFYRFIALDLLNQDEDTKVKIEIFIKELFNEVEKIEQKGLTFYIYFENTNLDFESIFATVNDDFSTTIKVFISGKILFKNKKAFSQIVDVYLKYSYKQSNFFTNTRSLIIDISKANYSILKNIQGILLNKVNEDIQLKNLIIGMFNNNLNVTKTSIDVYLHRNTINNKLNLIYEETSLDMQNFNDAVAMYLLIKA